MTTNEIRQWIDTQASGIEQVTAAIGADLKRNNEGFVVDDSDLGITVRELDRIVAALSRLSYRLAQ